MFRHPQATPSRGGMAMNQTVQYLAAKNRAKAAMDKGPMPMSTGNGRRSEGVVIQPVDEDEGIEYSAKRIAAARFERNHRLIADLFNPNVVADSRNVVMQSRMETLKKQGNSLKLHQEKLEEELGRLENVFNEKKRQLEKNSEEFAVNLKKVCDDKPQLDMDKFNKMVEDWTGTLLKKYQEYQKTQEELMQKQEAEKKETPVLFSLVGGLDSTPPPPDGTAEGSQTSEGAQPTQAVESAEKPTTNEEEPEQMETDSSVPEAVGSPVPVSAEASESVEATIEAHEDNEATEASAEKMEPEEASKSEESNQSASVEGVDEIASTKTEERPASNEA